jgi:two-component system alkaline phosphatase synthesis response regulator PhoP
LLFLFFSVLRRLLPRGDLGKEAGLNPMGTVLIVDDDKDILTVMLYGLESYGYLVRTCENALTALGNASQETFDYIITDLDMPGMDGLALTRMLRQEQPRAVIIGMSGKDMGVPFLEAGANDFIRKPFVPFDLATMIDGGDLP